MASRHLLNRLYPTQPTTIYVGGVCLGYRLHKKSPCSAEADPQRLKRPPKFGSSIPSITKRGITSSPKDAAAVSSNRHNCPMCKKFGSGPCGGIFKRWLDCTDQHPGNDDEGQPLHLAKCSEFTVQLSQCLDDHSDYYTKYDEQQVKNKDSDASEDLKAAWCEFVKHTEEQISAQVYKVQEFPADISPQIQVRLQSETGAAYFKPQKDNGASIVVAYIIEEDDGNILAAGSKEDMDMGSQHGCVLMFDVPTGLRAATCRAIYEGSDDSVTVFSKTMLVPAGNK